MLSQRTRLSFASLITFLLFSSLFFSLEAECVMRRRRFPQLLQQQQRRIRDFYSTISEENETTATFVHTNDNYEFEAEATLPITTQSKSVNSKPLVPTAAAGAATPLSVTDAPGIRENSYNTELDCWKLKMLDVIMTDEHSTSTPATTAKQPNEKKKKKPFVAMEREQKHLNLLLETWDTVKRRQKEERVKPDQHGSIVLCDDHGVYCMHVYLYICVYACVRACMCVC